MNDIATTVIEEIQDGTFADNYDAALLRVNSIVVRLTSYPDGTTDKFFRACIGSFFKEIAAHRIMETYKTPVVVPTTVVNLAKGIEKDVGRLIGRMEHPHVDHMQLTRDLAGLLTRVSSIAVNRIRLEKKYMF